MTAPAVPRDPDPPGGPDDPTSAVIVAGGEETRVLLRGLLRLHHCRVVGESEGSTRALELLRQHRPGLVLLETSLAEGSASALVRQAIEFLPNVRLVVIGAFDPHGEPPPPASVVTYLGRPFRIAEFARAIRGEVATAEHPEL